MNFKEIIEKLGDGKGYLFTCDGLQGHFYKAPFPSQERHTLRDGAHSAITFWNLGQRASPTLMLYDFDDDEDWSIVECDDPLNTVGTK